MIYPVDSAIRRLNNRGQGITAKLNEGKTKTFSQKTVQRVLHLEGYKRWLAKKKMVVREANRKQRVKWVVKWCKDSRQLLGKSSVFRWKSDFALYKPSCLHLATRRRKVQPTSYLLSLWTDKFGDLGRCLNSDCWWRQHQLCQVRWHPRRKRTFGQQFSGILKEKNTCSWMTMRLFTEPTLQNIIKIKTK